MQSFLKYEIIFTVLVFSFRFKFRYICYKIKRNINVKKLKYYLRTCPGCMVTDGVVALGLLTIGDNTVFL